jgi:hypothetical protein
MFSLRNRQHLDEGTTLRVLTAVSDSRRLVVYQSNSAAALLLKRHLDREYPMLIWGVLVLHGQILPLRCVILMPTTIGVCVHVLPVRFLVPREMGAIGQTHLSALGISSRIRLALAQGHMAMTASAHLASRTHTTVHPARMVCMITVQIQGPVHMTMGATTTIHASGIILQPIVLTASCGGTFGLAIEQLRSRGATGAGSSQILTLTTHQRVMPCEIHAQITIAASAVIFSTSESSSSAHIQTWTHTGVDSRLLREHGGQLITTINQEKIEILL